MVFPQTQRCNDNKSGIFCHWTDSGLKAMKEASTPISDALLSSYDIWVREGKAKASEQSRNNGAMTKVIAKELEHFIRGLIKQMALCGQGMGKKILIKLLEQSLQTGPKKTITHSVDQPSIALLPLLLLCL